MAATYKAFLNAPDASHLSPEASINYITTTTSISEPTAILKHLKAQLNHVTKKKEHIFNAIETSNALCLETETTLAFGSGGGAYLPGIDENLLDEREVTLPIVHVVSFDSNGKINQIRLYWDQGTLLKQVEAIGRTGRNWPIRDGKNLIEAVKNSVAKGGQSANGSVESRPRNQSDAVAHQHKRGDSVSATRDPHASLALFAPRDPNADARSYDGPSVAKRESAKPAARDYSELFAGDETPKQASSQRSASPSKIDGRSVKYGAGKNMPTNRIFDENIPFEASTANQKKTYDNKYDHFAFGDGEDADQTVRPNSGKSGISSKAPSHFSFEDFHTPPKVTPKYRPDDDRHWGAGVDEDAPPTQPKREVVHAPRKDADTHYTLSDDSPAHIPNRPLNPATSVNASRRDEDFAHHTDSPAKPQQHDATSPSTTGFKKIYNTAGDGMGGRKIKGEETLAESQKKIYKTAGDGMGGRKGSGRLWGFGDESDPEAKEEVVRTGRGRRQQQEAGAGY
nr:hypothetical protein B0A51_04527 [Rachicladosporium sp. CCFEE 5018]